MSLRLRPLSYFLLMALLLVAVGMGQSWSVSLSVLNLCLISAIMALGVNMQWGYAGLFNVGIMGFAALGGLAAMLVSKAPVKAAWVAGGLGLFGSLGVLLLTIGLGVFFRKIIVHRKILMLATVALCIASFFLIRFFFDPATEAIEAINASKEGYLGGLGFPVLFSWIVGGFFAAGAAWLVGKITLGLRADYLAIATLGISEIIIAVLKNEDWLTRGVKNVTGLPRPIPDAVEWQQYDWFIGGAERLGLGGVEASSIFVKLCYAALFAGVLLVIFWLAERALRSPWGRMMRAIRDNREAAQAMGKDVTGRHLQIFILGSAVVGLAGAMLTTYDGQFTPGTYHPLRFTFLIWVMVIVGGAGNNWGAVLGGVLIWFVWIQAEPMGFFIIDGLTAWLPEESLLRQQLLKNAPHMRMVFMGTILLLVMRFSPQGLIPESSQRFQPLKK